MIVIIAGILLVGFLTVGLVFMLALRKWTFAEQSIEDRLRSSNSATVTYVVPHEQDPALLMTALAREGFVSVPDVVGGVERVLIECDEADRTKVRRIIEHVDRTGFDGTPMHTGRVRFEDEIGA